jgi:hypothetical protein
MTNVETPANVKILINIGACLDIPTGTFVFGKYGESILLGGLGWTTAVVGIGNCFKSTLMHYMTLSAASRIYSTTETAIATYDTEINIHEDRLFHFSLRFESFADKNIIQDGTWVITDKTIYYANDWYEKLKEYLKAKVADKGNYVTTPFLSRDQKTNLQIMTPTFGQIDSFSEFETEDVAKIQDENELGEAGGNTVHMRQGLAKTRFLMDIPRLTGGSNHFLLMTAHIGKGIEMAAGPYAPPPTKTLQHLKNGDKLKGVTGKFTFLMANCWHAINASPMVNQGTKGPEYPKEGENSAAGMDLNMVSIKQLRGKSGPTGNVINILVSQLEGVLPELTEFENIKTNDRFGLGGNVQNYFLEIYPECKLSRTVVRSKIDRDPKLRRALNITSELCQMHQYYRHITDELTTPAEMYKVLTEKGYDWNFILENTRGWWTVNDEKHPKYFLSTMDLCRMVKGKYHPYWLEDDCKTIKKQFAKN